MTSVPLRRCLSRNIFNFHRKFNVKNYQYPFICNYSNLHNVVRHHVVKEPKYVVRFFATNETDPKLKPNANETPEDDKKPGLMLRLKQMYRDYWYVLVPVHLITSAGWLGGFYYMAKSGVDIVSLLQSMGFSENFTSQLNNSKMGYLAISYALYKIITPVRYTVTLGGTTISIKYLKEWGYIKPVPSKDKLKEMYMEKRDTFRDTYHETKEELRQRKDQLKERKDNIMGDYTNFKKELKEIKSKTVQKVVPHCKEK